MSSTKNSTGTVVEDVEDTSDPYTQKMFDAIEILGKSPAKLSSGSSSSMKKGGSVSSASKRADGCAQRGKTRGKIV